MEGFSVQWIIVVPLKDSMKLQNHLMSLWKASLGRCYLSLEYCEVVGGSYSRIDVLVVYTCVDITSALGDVADFSC